MIITLSIALEYEIGSLVYSDIGRKCLVMGCKNDDRFERFFSVDEKIDE